MAAVVAAPVLELSPLKAAIVPGPEPFTCVQGMSYKWVSFEEAAAWYPLKCTAIDGDTPLDGTEEWIGIDKGPLFRGQLGTWEGVTLHEHK